jgi:single-stranded DNA-specific DHH superfamily exonuclease
VAFKVCEALLHAKLPRDQAHEASEALLDLVAIGTVADMVPLQRANRTLVQQGLRVLQRRQRVGINAMLQLAGVDPEATLTSETIGFTLGPRLNALGRLSNAAEAVTLLTTHNPDEARPIAEHLEVLNKKRQTLCDTTFEQAQHLLQTTGGVDGRKVIILGHEGWNPGVIGIVASRLIETYHRPTLLMVLQPDQHKARGSARSIPGFHMAKALEGVSDLLLHHGGHAGAAGFALEMQHLSAFKQRLQTLAEREIPDEWLVPTVEVDCKLTFEQLTPGLLELQENLAPFGMGNPAPLFALENASIASQKALGTEAQHLKLMLQPPNAKGFKQGIEALWWRAGAGVSVDASQPYHVAFTAEANNTQYGGGPVRLTLKALQPSKPTSHPLPSGEGRVRENHNGVQKGRPSPAAPAAASPEGRGDDAPLVINHTASAQQWHDARSPETAELPDVGNVSDTALATRLQTPDTKELWLLYNEGRAPSLPLWPNDAEPTQEPAGVINRLTASPCHTLLLWDIPPSPALTHTLLATCQPRHVVLMGRKYEDVPLKLEAVTFLKGLYQGLRRLPPASQPATAVGGLTLEQIACRFATTPELVALCLSLYERLGLAVLAPQAETLAVAQWVEAPPVAWANVAQRHASELWLLQRLIDEVAAWRTWVRQAELSALQRVVGSAVLHVTQPLLSR